MISTGLSYLDSITSGLRLGDNVVWKVSDAVPIDLFIKSFFSEPNEFQETIIYVNFNYSPHTICKKYEYLFRNKKVILIDAFTHGKGNSDPVFLDFYQAEHHYGDVRFICLDNPREKSSFTKTLNEVELGNTEGCFYIFDSLTGMNELWKDETAVLDFFTFTCPKLYDLNTLAYWVLERKAHSKEFLAGIMHITQVIFSLRPATAGQFELKILKLEDRSLPHGSGPVYFKVADKNIQFQEEKPDDHLPLGEKVRQLRKENKLTQAELASTLSMTPGAVSQIENDLITPSLTTMFQMARLFNKSLDFFFDLEENQAVKNNYHLTRRLRISSANRQLEIFRLNENDRTDLQAYLVTLKGMKIVEGPIMLHKGKEFITVLGGSLALVIDGEKVVLAEGDSITITRSFIEKMQNAEGSRCRFLYILI